MNKFNYSNMFKNIKIKNIMNFQSFYHWLYILFFIILFLSPAGRSEDTYTDYYKWSNLPGLPPASQRDLQPGVAGAFAGSHNGVLILAGGANFPEDMPWEGGKKLWHDDIFIMRETEEGFSWLNKTFKLNRPLAYGVSISTDEGVVCIGGCDSQHVYQDCFILKWDEENEMIKKNKYPSLPQPLSFMTGAMANNKIFIAGGQSTMEDSSATKAFYMLDISQNGTDEFKWISMHPWPGDPRVFPVSSCQSDGVHNCFYLFSGRNIQPDTPTVPLTDAYKFDIITQSWSRLSDISIDKKETVCLMAGASWACGANHIMVLGGDEGPVYLELEKMAFNLKEALNDNNMEAAGLLRSELNNAYAAHEGFSRSLYAYHTITNTWVEAGKFPSESPVNCTAVHWPSLDSADVIIPSGEIKPGVRTPEIWFGDVDISGSFHWLDYTVMAAFLLLLVIMGIYFSKKMKDTNDFFKAGQRIPWWAAALSIYGTQLSAISFMAIPAKTFASDWRYFHVVFAIVAVAPFIVFCFLPFYRRLNITTAYEYLELRFNLTIRLLGSSLFMLMQLSRIGIVLYLPSIALSIVTGININICILVMGFICIFYAVMGGIEAVIWTDVIQVIILLTGAVSCMFLIPFNVPGGWNGMVDIADAARKFRFWDFRFDLCDATFVALFFGAFAQNIISYGTDQTVIQRYLTTSTEKKAAKSIWISAIICIPSSMIFFGIGSALFVFYTVYPAELNPAIKQTDAIFPYFIVTQLPIGLVGLVIAAVFAAAMSSLDSSMNSVGAAVTTDFYKRLGKDHTERKSLLLARASTLFVGLIGTVLALIMAQLPIKSLWDHFSGLLGLFGGGLGGLFLLGIFTKRTGSLAAFLAFIISAVIQLWVKNSTNVNVWVFALSGLLSCFTVGVLLSFIFPNRKKYTVDFPLSFTQNLGNF
ncbi:Na(+)/glucose symporter [Limihaloglobus sulfuriphilus]|uniref:Na(+)/glucose symporter n=1 Tax=Limihaloglobus sulfuriphilus TaxID=1851148 RepID=A0A1Q2MCP7_9BACT|nr:sodium/solute symporter [Limihaloglobus sulfuriphilus]AQQ70471.1 Na(+)/glucose symporter [Limihaloglobus sulfuriphilus]